MNPASASPLLIAVMPCSRTPKQMFRPEKSAGVTLLEPRMSVLLLATRSALPPMRFGTSAAAFCMTTLPCARVAAVVVGAVSHSRSIKPFGTRASTNWSHAAERAGSALRQRASDADHWA